MKRLQQRDKSAAVRRTVVDDEIHKEPRLLTEAPVEVRRSAAAECADQEDLLRAPVGPGGNDEQDDLFVDGAQFNFDNEEMDLERDPV